MSDNISRKAALDAVSYETFECYEARKAIRALPSTDRDGHWVHDKQGHVFCSECGTVDELNYLTGNYMYSNFCAECGADMRGGKHE